MAGPAGYAAWAARYLHEYGCDRDDFGLVAVNSRSNAEDNDHAVFRTPLTMEKYRQAPMIMAPFSLLDMDVPVDGAHAFVLTAATEAASLVERPVLVHAATMGGIDRQLDQTAGLTQHGQHVVVAALRARSDLWLGDFDVVYPYDGFSWLTLMWLEALGWCGPGEAAKFLRSHWDDATNRVLIGGRVPVNTHGGSLSEGATQGSGHLHEAVVQLQGRAGRRQVEGASTALVVPGGIFHNPHGFVLRV
jgi:acetyl-CoA acetyltransferase